MQTSKALIFDIKKFALHDGLGIRTTIFFKGCPLRCLWCHNPEGLDAQKQLIFHKEKCIHCKMCIKNDIYHQLEYIDYPIIKNPFGNYNHIIESCPTNSLTYDSQYYSLSELLEIIEEDRVFYRDHGGVTLSGGEIFMHYDFICRLLKECHKRHIHTAVETSAYTSFNKFQTLFALVDMIYIDLKLLDSDKHKKYTGVDNKQILENINYALKVDYQKVIIRTPLIQSINADKASVSDICHYLKKCHLQTQHELLNYNHLAASKYALLNKAYSLKDIKPLSKENFRDLKMYAKSILVNEIV